MLLERIVNAERQGMKACTVGGKPARLLFATQADLRHSRKGLALGALMPLCLVTSGRRGACPLAAVTESRAVRR